MSNKTNFLNIQLPRNLSKAIKHICVDEEITQTAYMLGLIYKDIAKRKAEEKEAKNVN